VNNLKGALRDIYVAVLRYELWLTLGWRDVLSRYRRSWLGSLWITLSMAIVAGVMGSLYSAIMQRPASEYIPYLTAGFITWNLLSSLIIEGTQSFVSNSAAIKEIPVPNSVYIFRLIWRNILIFGHNIVVYLLLLLLFQISPFPAVLLALPALALILLNGIWIGLLFGLINARFRDFSQFVNNSMRLLFFITPVIWYGELATGLRGAFVHLNPFYYFIEILRAPMLGLFPSIQIWVVAIAITAAGWMVTLPVYARWRRQIAYWV
jgi:ABC-type polysaccharide/polyol phosphate export permease